MKFKLYQYLTVSLVIVSSCNGQQSESDLILGKWVEESRVTYGADSLFSFPLPANWDENKEKKSKPKWWLIFRSDGVVLISSNDKDYVVKGKYSIVGDSLFISTRESFKITELSDSLFVYSENGFFEGEFLLNRYRKVE